MTELSIRNVEDADLPSVLEMVQALAAHHGDAAQISLTELERDCLGTAPWLRVLVAVRGADILGYAALCPLAQMQFGVRGMDMHHLFVRADARGQGVGRALIDASIALTKSLGCRYMTVGTHPDNREAAMVYQAAGFDSLPPPGPRFRIKI
ncbi:GNAT family N-acetyltransferase [Sulfitobacter pacificus]|uniref:GNAT family N-acetyltransferase n=1 Tax=Sulfitobacter pacificus TaxID=1499314 RepID=UPI00310667D8